MNHAMTIEARIGKFYDNFGGSIIPKKERELLREMLQEVEAAAYARVREEVVRSLPHPLEIDGNAPMTGDGYATGYRNGHIRGVELTCSETRKRILAAIDKLTKQI